MQKKIYRYGIIGTGRKHRSEGSTGFGMAHEHIRGYQRTERVVLAAIADIDPEAANLFVAEYSPQKVYSDYKEMLAKENLDIVSVTTWPHLHSEMVIEAANAGVRAIHCEKPMAVTWGECKRMYASCKEKGVNLIFDHQRRYLEPFQRARELIHEGAIGDLVRLEANTGDMFDWGTHWLNMMFFFNNEVPARWVLAQIDSHTGRRIYGAPAEDQAICQFQFENGVRGLMITGADSDIGCAIRAVGSNGMLEIVWGDPSLRYIRRGDANWIVVPTSEGIHGGEAISRAAADMIKSMDIGGSTILSADSVIHSTEIIFACYESSRRRGRVNLPLDIDDSPIQDMLDKKLIGPERA